MSNKQSIKFGDICQEVKITTKNPIADGYDRYIGLEHLDSGSLKIKRWGMIAEDNPSFTRVFKKGHILFGKRRPYLKKAAVAEFDGVCSADIIVLEPTGNYIPSSLIPFLVQSDVVWMHAIKTSSGSLSPRTKFSALSELRIQVDTEADAYSSYLKLLEAIEVAIINTESLILSSNILLDALINDARKGNWGKGGNNNSWSNKRLRDVVDFKNGKAHEKFIVQDGKYVVVNSKFIASDGIEFIASNQSFCPASRGDVLMVMSDVPNGKALAKCFLVNDNNVYTVNQRVALFSPSCDSHFLFYILNRNPYYMRFDDGLKQTNLRKDEVLDCPVLIPELFLQKKIAHTLEELDALILNASKKCNSLIELKLTITRNLFATAQGI